MIGFKTLRALYDWHETHPTVKDVVEIMLAGIWPTDRDLIITRIAERTPEQKTEVHTDGPPHRAIDFRISHVPFQTAQRATDRLNEIFIYDPERPAMQVALLHDAGSGNHLHIQVHANTTRRPVTMSTT